MFDHMRHLSEAFYPYFLRLHGSLQSDFFYAAAIFAWAKALTAIGAAYMKRMIPLRTMAMLGNVFGVVAGISAGSLATFIEHAVNLPSTPRDCGRCAALSRACAGRTQPS